MAQARYFGWEGNQGEGIALGRDMGGAVADMDAYQGLGLLPIGKASISTRVF